MTKIKSNAAAKTAAKATEATVAKRKSVLSEKDILPGIKTSKEMADQTERELRKESAETGKPRARAALANGVDSRSAPHSAKSVADNRPKASNKTDKAVTAKAAKTDAKATKTAARAEKAAPKADDTRKITVVDKKFTYGREGSSRRSAWDAAKSGITVAAYIAAGGKAKYLPRWTAAGAIKLD